MSREKKDWVYIWGIGWWDPNDTGVLPFKFNGCAATLVATLAFIGLVLLGVAVVELVLPWLPWL